MLALSGNDFSWNNWRRKAARNPSTRAAFGPISSQRGLYVPLGNPFKSAASGGVMAGAGCVGAMFHRGPIPGRQSPPRNARRALACDERVGIGHR
jgi:hypothetical protein